jgi:hypothetical protein
MNYTDYDSLEDYTKAKQAYVSSLCFNKLHAVALANAAITLWHCHVPLEQARSYLKNLEAKLVMNEI